LSISLSLYAIALLLASKTYFHPSAFAYSSPTMAGLLERARSVFRRRPRDDEDDFAGPEFDDFDNQDERGPITPVVGPNGIVQSHPETPHHPNQHHPHHQQHHPQHHEHGHPHGGDGAPPLTHTPATRSGQLEIALKNDTTSSTVYAYISKLNRDMCQLHF
jgi:hypothetical protein